MESRIKSFWDYFDSCLKEANEPSVVLTEEQIAWLNKICDNNWSLNAKGQVDITGSFDCAAENLTDFKGIQFGIVNGSFYCEGNKDLKSLKGAPIVVNGSFHCDKTGITTLEYAPRKVRANVYFDKCKNLVSLIGSMEEAGDNFNCYGCHNLKSFIGAPIAKNYHYHDCPLIPEKEIQIADMEENPNKIMFKMWLESKLPIEEFWEKKKGTIRGKKYGI
jgi:hypothetical protein